MAQLAKVGPYMVVSTVVLTRHYIFSSTSFSIDINECNTSNGGCEQLCIPYVITSPLQISMNVK